MSFLDPVEDFAHGLVIRDPYRWLEDRSRLETHHWIRDQKQRCDEYFDACPDLEAITRRVRDYLEVEVTDQPARVRDRYFYRKRRIGQEQGSICTRDASDNQECTLIDPSKQGKFTSVGIYRISPDGRFLAYELRRGGEDCNEIRIVDVDRKAVLPNGITSGYGRGLSFAHDGFFYSHDEDQHAEEHRISYESFRSPGQSRVAFRAPRTRGSRLTLIGNRDWLGVLWLHPEGAAILRDFWVAELVDETPDWIEVFRDKRAPCSPTFYRDRILALIEPEPDKSQIIELSRSGEEIGLLVPPNKTPIRQVAVVEDRLFASYIEAGVQKLDAWRLEDQRAGSVNLPEGGTVWLLPSTAQEPDSVFCTFESFDIPPMVYEFDTSTNNWMLWHQRGPTGRKKQSRIQETSFLSKDDVEIPLTLVTAQCDEPETYPRPVIMTSYGGFGVSMTPQFSVLAAILIEFGVILAIPHIRGGGEFGKAWHEAGRARNRQTAFDDFIGAAEWMCRQGITAPHCLAIFGGSNAGLLVAVAMTQRPDLFGAVLCVAAPLDMARHEYLNPDSRWQGEYGTIEDPEDFQVLYAYSPYHRVLKNVNYPPTLFVTGDKDDRCNPAHVRKMAAELQGRDGQRSQIIVDYSEQRGHSPVLPLSERISALARRIAFLCRELALTFPHGRY